MKPRTRFFVAILFLVVVSGVTVFAFSRRNQEPAPVFRATINRDCAPADGPAFTVSIPYSSGSFINISIWQSPDIRLPATYWFPDKTGRGGNVTFLLRYSYSVPLTGKVFFWRVRPESPVEGWFDLLTTEGQRLRGKFRAEWGNLRVYCG